MGERDTDASESGMRMRVRAVWRDGGTERRVKKYAHASVPVWIRLLCSHMQTRVRADTHVCVCACTDTYISVHARNTH